jgi:dephospho-CoA kinase
MPYTVGLTGGIGSGKSVVANLFEKLGAAVIDTDAIAHQLTLGGGAAIPAIQAQFGADFLNADGSLNRAAMRQRVFSDSTAKQTLETVLHPLIRRQVEAQIAVSDAPYVLLAIPLLVETGAYLDHIERVVVVDCNESLQLARTVARSSLAPSEVKAIMATQVSRVERLRHADDIILNNGELSSLSIPVAVIDQRLRALATAQKKRD